jgi:hypothetical protein
MNRAGFALDGRKPRMNRAGFALEQQAAYFFR